jgi:hypothetical protein
MEEEEEVGEENVGGAIFLRPAKKTWLSRIRHLWGFAPISSRAYPQNQYLKNSATSKTKYTNTQQDLPVIGYTLVR